MKKYFTQLFCPPKSYMQQGFTLVETIVAIFILTLTVGALLTLTAGGLFTIRYAKNDIVATNLLQESLEYIRNTRDTAAQTGTTWDTWLSAYSANGCMTANGCMINPYAVSPASKILSCPNVSGRLTCNFLYFYPYYGFYNYFASANFYSSAGHDSGKELTSFRRTVTMQVIPASGANPDPQLIVTARMDWKNGTNTKSVAQSMTLTKWNLQ